MKRIFPLLLTLLTATVLHAQSYYWVMLTDKGNAVFDPYNYFDTHALARYQACGADLHDLSNYPLDSDYTKQVNDLACEELGASRWLNAMAVKATPDQAERIGALPFVKAVLAIRSDAQLAQHDNDNADAPSDGKNATRLTDQLKRMQGHLFVRNGLDGSGLRIAVFDGGFPHVDTHPAFAHLRDGKRIVDTWNFPNKKADVYGWNSHGTMTLSCITGIFNGRQLGLATGAEVMLYRTEVELEPAKEEVWWMMAMERADQYGANIVSSSLGYGKERYYTTDMDGTSLVARAANMAARKGMLVCNSAGNEGTENQWKTIITPADADSVLCIGGTTSSLTQYNHIYFSSYGPSADGRMKPNVSAFGHALAATPSKDSVTYVDGTSFSCPLVAGFAACAWQSNRNLSAMQMKEAIERSGDLYPYFDYALGYGVPQASFFTETRQTADPTFRFEESTDSVTVYIPEPGCRTTVFYNKQRPGGMLDHYANLAIESRTPVRIRFHKASLDSCTLNVWFDGYTNSYLLTAADQVRWSDTSLPFRPNVASEDGDATHSFRLNRALADNKPSARGIGGRWHRELYVDFGSMVNTESEELTLHGFSSTAHIGLRHVRALGKYYSLGAAFEWGRQRYNLDKTSNNGLDTRFGLDADHDVKFKQLYHNDWSLEVFQRVCFVRGGLLSRGIYWDLGFYGSYSNFHYKLATKKNNGVPAMEVDITNPAFDGRYFWNWGMTTRIAYDIVGIYARYRMTTCHIADDAVCPIRLPRLEAGIELNF
ncbi:MAG: peptidase S8 [bacterium P3]|nr:MAG: peptidase S8 [bacterium P3]KWW41483.1 MAG: peptidase S8 and S53 subtilisin kexin sedolisin [bacterium F083]